MKSRLRSILNQMEQGLHDRSRALALALLALLSQENLFFLGPPGVAKSMISRRLTGALKGGNHFEYLMGRYTIPEELFGPFSLKNLRSHDEFVRKTEGYLPEADIAFLDEIWRSSSPIQNTLLTILNERVFRNGPKELSVPLKTLVAAANQLPDMDEDHQAVWDRFLIRLEILPIATTESFRNYLSDESAQSPNELQGLDTQEWEEYRAMVDRTPIDENLYSFLGVLRERFQEEDSLPYVSDRRWKKILSALRCAGAAEELPVGFLQLGLTEHMLWDHPSQKPTIQEALLKTLDKIPPPNSTSWMEMEKELRSYKQEVLDQCFQQEKRKVWEPELVHGEYLESDLTHKGKRVRIWFEDWRGLQQEGEAEVELIFLENDGVQEIQTQLVKLAQNPPGILLEGASYPLKGAYRETMELVRIEPNDEVSSKLDSKKDAVAKSIENESKTILEEEKTLPKRAEDLLFHPGDFWVEAMRQALARKQLLIENYRRELEEIGKKVIFHG